MSPRAAAGWVLALALPAAALAQQTREEEYRPLFAPETIQNAAPDQAARMKASEARNRQAWNERQDARRKQAADEKAAAVAASQPPAPPRAKSKVYRWVDENGRVHFGDAPGARGATVVEVGGIARVKGKPPPAPGSTGGEKEAEPAK